MKFRAQRGLKLQDADVEDHAFKRDGSKVAVAKARAHARKLELRAHYN